MSTFIQDFIEREKINRRNFLLASAAGLGGAARRACLAQARRAPR